MSREPPPALPGGRGVADLLYYTGKSQNFDNGDKLVHGQRGEVVGPATHESHKGKGVAVLFPGNKGWVDCYLDMVRRLHAAFATPPPRHRRRHHLPAHDIRHCATAAPQPPRQAPPCR